MNKKLLIVLPLVSTFLFSGCATLVGGGTKQSISINNSKTMKGKMTYADGTGVQYFTTPATIKVNRRYEDIKIMSMNNEFNDVVIDSELNPWIWGNALFYVYGIVPITTDAASGAMWKYDESVNISLKIDD